MVLTHPFLLFGLILIAVPLILHLLMRAKPKKLLFPALRLIQNRKRTNTRRMRLRHLALLLLRMLVIALLAFALARPAVPAADYAPQAGDWVRLLIVAFRRGWVPTVEEGGDGHTSATAYELALAA